MGRHKPRAGRGGKAAGQSQPRHGGAVPGEPGRNEGPGRCRSFPVQVHGRHAGAVHRRGLRGRERKRRDDHGPRADELRGFRAEGDSEIFRLSGQLTTSPPASLGELLADIGLYHRQRYTR